MIGDRNSDYLAAKKQKLSLLDWWIKNTWNYFKKIFKQQLNFYFENNHIFNKKKV